MVSDPTPKSSGPGVPTPAATTGAAQPDAAYVPPGRIVSTTTGQPLTTIVSTGALVCLWDPVTGIGGAAHFLLPSAGTAPPATRFGDVAIAALIAELAKLGAAERRLRARIFGGSAPPLVTHGGHLGDHNIEAATAVLGQRHIPVMERETGGDSARKVLFSPRSGAAEVSRVGLGWTRPAGGGPAPSHVA